MSSPKPLPHISHGRWSLAPPRTNGLAIASLGCSLAALVLGAPSVAAIIFGFVARDQIRHSQGTQKGKGMALAGIIVGMVALVAMVAIVIFIVSRRTTTTTTFYNNGTYT